MVEFRPLLLLLLVCSMIELVRLSVPLFSSTDSLRLVVEWSMSCPVRCMMLRRTAVVGVATAEGVLVEWFAVLLLLVACV